MSEPVARLAMPGQSGARPARRASRAALRFQWVAGHSPDPRVRDRRAAEFGRGRTRVDDAAGVDDPLDARRRVLGDVVLEDQRALGAGLAGTSTSSLTAQGAPPAGAAPGRGRSGPRPPGPLRRLIEYRTGSALTTGLSASMCSIVGLQEFDGRELAAAERARRRLARGQVAQVVGHQIPLLARARELDQQWTLPRGEGQGVVADSVGYSC